MKTKDYEKLSEYTNLESSELGEYCNNLLLMRDYHPSHGMSERFNAELEVELYHQLEQFKLYSRIVERREEVKETRTYKELLWIDK